MQWTDLLAAIALYLVLEGIMPFASPSLMKRVMLSFAQSTDRQLRVERTHQHARRSRSSLFRSRVVGFPYE